MLRYFFHFLIKCDTSYFIALQEARGLLNVIRPSVLYCLLHCYLDSNFTWCTSSEAAVINYKVTESKNQNPVFIVCHFIRQQRLLLMWLIQVLLVMPCLVLIFVNVPVVSLSLPSTSITSSNLPKTAPNIPIESQHIDEESNEDVLEWLRQQQLEVSLAQAHVVQKLRDIGIPVGLPKKVGVETQEDSEQRIVTSTEDNHIECRITLDRAQLGRKCVAPCQCTGSQKWVQFSVFNKLRRKDPKSWVTCPTCRTKYVYDILLANSDFKTSLLSALLDNMGILRSILMISLITVAIMSGFPKLVASLMVSREFWQWYPHWSKFMHLPLFMKLYIGKQLGAELYKRYLQLEADYIAEPLANIETNWLEDSLPSPNHPSSTSAVQPQSRTKKDPSWSEEEDIDDSSIEEGEEVEE